MTDTGPSNLRNNTGLDLHWQGPFKDNSIVNPYKWLNRQKGLNSVRETYLLDPTSGSDRFGYGTDLTPLVFTLDRRSTLVGDMRFRYKRTAVTLAGTGAGNEPYFPDFEGYASIKYIEWRFGGPNGTLIEKKYGFDLYKTMKRMWTKEARLAEGNAQNGNMTDAERIMKAATDDYITIDIQAPWSDPNRHLPYSKLPGDLFLKIWFKPLKECLRTTLPSTATCTISNPILEIESFHLDQDAEIAYNDKMKSGAKLKTVNMERHLDIVLNPAGGGIKNPTIVDLDNITGSAFAIEVSFRRLADVQVDGTADPWKWFLPDIKQVKITVQGKDILVPVTIKHMEGKNKFHCFETVARMLPNGEIVDSLWILFIEPEYFIPSFRSCHGDRFMLAYTKPKLQIDWMTVPTESLLMDVQAYVHDELTVSKEDFRPLGVQG